MTDNHLEAAFREGDSWLRVIGRATYSSAPALRSLVKKTLSGGTHLLQVDLSRCLSMDSTFIGVLTKSAMGREQDSIEVRLVNTPEHVARQVRGLGLGRFFRFIEGTPPDSDWQRVVGNGKNTAGPGDGLRETMLEAHEALGQASPENVPRFKNVIDALKEDS